MLRTENVSFASAENFDLYAYKHIKRDTKCGL